VLQAGRVQVLGGVDELLAAHRRLVGPRCETASLAGVTAVVRASHTDKQTSLLVRTNGAPIDPKWTVSEVALEDLVLAYLAEPSAGTLPGPARSWSDRMTWLVWRQHRRQLLVTLLSLAAMAAVLLPTGRQVHAAFADTGLDDCLRKLGPNEFIDNVPGSDAGCGRSANRFNALYRGYLTYPVLLVLLPLLVGLFFGAPLVAREVEHHTHRLVWTQGVSRLRWAAAKFGLVGGAALVFAAAYALLASWWVYPLARANSARFEPLAFDLQGVVPVGYTVFAVALGVFAGTVWRKVLPAMAVTLFGFVGARIAVMYARPRFLPPQERRYPVKSDKVANWMRGDWVLSRGVYDSSGTLIVPNGDVECGPPSMPERAGTCADNLGAYNLQVVQPIGRFWLFQYIEAGLFVAASAVLVYLAVQQVRRRIT
jgi:hypothetical protein